MLTQIEAAALQAKRICLRGPAAFCRFELLWGTARRACLYRRIGEILVFFEIMVFLLISFPPVGLGERLPLGHVLAQLVLAQLVLLQLVDLVRRGSYPPYP